MNQELEPVPGSHTNQKQTLARGLKNRHVQLIAIGGAIGTGLFLGSGHSIALAGPSILFAYIITGGICFLMMRALGELLLSNTNYHTFIEFVQDYMGEKAAFVTGWTYWFCWISVAMADITAVGIYVKYWFPNIEAWIPSLVTLFILLLMNLLTVKLFGELEFWFACIKVVAILALIGLGAYFILQDILLQWASLVLVIYGVMVAGFLKVLMDLFNPFKWLYLLLLVLNW